MTDVNAKLVMQEADYRDAPIDLFTEFSAVETRSIYQGGGEALGVPWLPAEFDGITIAVDTLDKCPFGRPPRLFDKFINNELTFIKFVWLGQH